MNKNVKVDWDAFNYIHSNNTRDAFQKLTEQLFCFEYNQPYGIFRFFNQPYIETMPISQGSETIGFQSKYYDPATSLSSKKQDLINAITGAHSKYPALSKIVFYINKEPGMGKSEQNEKPKYINDVEEHGEKYGIHVEWKGLNQIETILLQPELETVRNYFFDTDGGIRKTIAQIQSHTTSMFDSIATDIQYQGISIRIQREAIDIDEFLQSEKRILVVYGDGGCGKSALVKQQLGTENHFPVWFFRAIDMDNTTVPEFVRRFGDNTWEEVLSVFDNCSRKICIIDSAEKALEIHNQKTVEIIIRSLQNHGWHIIVTIRTSYLNSFINSLLKSSEVHKYSITNLSLDELTNLDTAYMLQLPSEPKTRELFCNLFNLKLYLSEGKNASINSSSDFHCFLWNRIICDTSKQGDALHVKRGETAKKMAKELANSGFAYYQPTSGDDWNAITSLNESGIIQHDSTMGGYFFCHDGYEEIILKQIITLAYRRRESAEMFFQEIGNSLSMRKAFRLWLISNLKETTDIDQFLIDVLNGSDYSFIWGDEILITLFSDTTDRCIKLCSELFSPENNDLLFRALRLLNTACKEVDDELYGRFLTKDEVHSIGLNIYRFTKPAGAGWDFLIPYTYEHRNQINWTTENTKLVTDTVYSWTQSYKEGMSTRNAGLLALFLYDKINSITYYSNTLKDMLSRIDDTIFNSAKEIQPELSNIFEEIISEKRIGHRDKYTELCNHLLQNSFNTGIVCSVIPDVVTKLANLFWLKENQDNDWWGNLDIGVSFQLREHIDYDYNPSSAFQTPMLALLNAEPILGVEFIIHIRYTRFLVY